VTSGYPLPWVWLTLREWVDTSVEIRVSNGATSAVEQSDYLTSQDVIGQTDHGIPPGAVLLVFAKASKKVHTTVPVAEAS